MRAILALLMLTIFHSMPMREAVAAWDDYDKGGTDLAGIAALAKHDRFYLLVKVCKRVDALHPWIYARCREVEREPDDCLDLWARFHYKSTVITFAGAIQEILNDPEITIGIFSHTRPDATKFLRQIKMELEGNQTLQAAFPDILWQNPAKEAQRWSEDGIVVKREGNPKEATIEAHGLVEGMPTGSHFRLRIYDDVVTDKAVTTPEQIHKATAAWELSDNLGMPGGRRWHIGTRYSFADTYESILKRGILKPRVYAATEDGTKTGKPVMLTDEEWADKLLTQSDAVLSCQMLQNPIAGQQAMFDVNWLRAYDIRPRTLMAYVLIDPARSQKKDSANTAMVVWGIDAQSNKWLLDGYNHKMALSERWEKMRDLRRKWLNAPGIQTVRVGYEVYGAQADMDYFEERMRLEKGATFTIDELAWPRDGEPSKVDRVQRLQPDMKMGRMYIPGEYPTLTAKQQLVTQEGQPYRIAKPIRQKDNEGNIYDLVQQFKEQVAFFPFGGLKDLVDASSRIYDIDFTPPVVYGPQQLEPEAFADS